MPVPPASRLLAAVLAAFAFSMTPTVSAAAAAAPVNPVDLAPAAAPAAAAAGSRTAHATGAYRITVRGWTRTIVRGNQSTIDSCRSATLWEGPLPGGRGTTWLAGHDHCGFYRWDRELRVGDRFTVSAPSGALLRYRVTGHGYVGRHGGSAGGLIHGDITLQTCHGSGTAFTYARLVG